MPTTAAHATPPRPRSCPEGALADLGARFRAARRAALRSILDEPSADEGAWVAAAARVDADELLRRVFDNGLRLGKGFARTYGTELALGQLPEVLEELGVPCLRGALRPAADEPALFLERRGCDAGAHGAAACDFYREATGGLVLGVTGGIRHTRTESLGHGGARCVDLFYVDPESDLRFGPLPEAMRAPLAEVTALARTFDASKAVVFLGISEGVLLYRVERAGCGGGVSVGAVVERAARRRFPEIALLEISPRPVLPDAGV